MEWFKHATKAHQDAKIRRLKHTYGIAAYGLYFHILERIMMECGNGNTSLMLEDDLLILEQDTGITQDQLAVMLVDMVNIGLFECDDPSKISDGVSNPYEVGITCPKLALRLTKAQVTPNMRAFVEKLQNEHGLE